MIDLNTINNIYVDLNKVFDGDSSVVYDIISDIKKPKHVMAERKIFYCGRYLILENNHSYNTTHKMFLGDKKEVSFDEFCNHIKIGKVLNAMRLMQQL